MSALAGQAVRADGDARLGLHVAEPDRLADRTRQFGPEDVVLAEQSRGITIVSRRAPAFRHADVLRNVDACLEGRDERVFHTTQPDGIAPTRRVGSRLLPEDGQVVGDAAKQAQNTALIDHELASPACDASRELPMRTRDARVPTG